MRLLTWPFLRYVLGRIVAGAALLIGVLALVFILIRSAPGDPIDLMLGDYPVPAEYREQLMKEMGLDQPLFMQFVTYGAHVLQGDLGFSWMNRQPVADLIMSRMPNTVLLVGSALVFAVIVGVAAGTWNARHSGSIVDRVSSFIGVAGYAMPVFWLGQLAILLFAIQWSIFPAAGMTSFRAPSEGFGRILDVAHHLVLPALVWSFRYIALFMTVTKVSMTEALGSDYIRTARAKGLSSGRVMRGHAMPNAAPPIVTIIGYEAGFILGGAVFVEVVFAWPGIGLLLLTSITNRDTPTVLGVFFVLSAGVIIMNLVADIINAALDPRAAVVGNDQ